MGWKPYWPALILALVPLACLLWGMVTGRMPQRYGTLDRQAEAPGFWMMTVVWGSLLALLLWIGFRL